MKVKTGRKSGTTTAEAAANATNSNTVVNAIGAAYTAICETLGGSNRKNPKRTNGAVGVRG